VCSTNEALLLNTRLRDISELDNQSTGFSNPCEECQKGLDMGAIMVIIADQARSGEKLADVYRTGHVVGLSEDWAKRALSGDTLKQALEKRILIMDYRIAIEMGLEVTYDPVTGTNPGLKKTGS
jgi:uncharacterized lipoprotein YajG